jgi:hypothetical protein
MARKPTEHGLALGDVVREYSRAEAQALADQWLAVYAANGTGPGSRRYLWHVFSYGTTPALEGADALARYAQQACAQYVALSNDRKSAFLTTTRPERNLYQDWFVFPPNLAWTMAFTHEDGWIGPFFATHPDHARLDAHNRAELARSEQERAARARKDLEIERARKRGWA